MPEYAAKIASQMRKGVLEYLTLGIIAQGEAYASDILKKLKGSRLLVVEGTLYPLLSRLKNEDLISYYWVESSGGPPRKYYRLTPKGAEMLQALNASWQTLSKAVSNIIIS